MVLPDINESCLILAKDISSTSFSDIQTIADKIKAAFKIWGYKAFNKKDLDDVKQKIPSLIKAEQRKTDESQFWKEKVRGLVDAKEMNDNYNELNTYLEKRGHCSY